MERRHLDRIIPKEAIGITFTRIGGEKEFLSMVNDFSKKGVGFSSPVEIARGTLIDITITDKSEYDPQNVHQTIGRVCWCSSDEIFEDTYNIGVEKMTLPAESIIQ